MAKRYRVSPTTIQKWRKRSTKTVVRKGPKEPRSTVLTAEEEAVVAFRRHSLLLLVSNLIRNCLYGLQPTIPHLTRSSLHGCLERHGISRLPEIEGSKPKTKRFADYVICYFHVDMAESVPSQRRVQDRRGQALPIRRDRNNPELVFAKLETQTNR